MNTRTQHGLKREGASPPVPSDRRACALPLQLSPGGWLLLGPLLGATAGTALYLTRDALRTHAAHWPEGTPPWTDLLLTPVLIGQAIFLALVVDLLIEAFGLLLRSRRVAGFSSEDETSWAGRTRCLALTDHHPRPRGDQRVRSLKSWRRRLELRMLARWMVYSLFALAPAFLGLVVGLNGVQINRGRSLHWLELFLPLLVGTAEGIFLAVLAGLVYWRGVRLLTAWLERCLELERPAAAPIPAAVAETSPQPAPPRRIGLRPVGTPGQQGPQAAEGSLVRFETSGESLADDVGHP